MSERSSLAGFSGPQQLDIGSMFSIARQAHSRVNVFIARGPSAPWPEPHDRSDGQTGDGPRQSGAVATAARRCAQRTVVTGWRGLRKSDPLRGLVTVLTSVADQRLRSGALPRRTRLRTISERMLAEGNHHVQASRERLHGLD
jgi:hypothetical protein